MSFKFDKAKSLDIADSILGMEFKRGARGPEAIDCGRPGRLLREFAP